MADIEMQYEPQLLAQRPILSTHDLIKSAYFYHILDTNSNYT